MIYHLVPVESSAIKAIGYRHYSHKLIIRFNSGDTYAYADVPLSVYKGLSNARSLGAFYVKNIKEVYGPGKKLSA